MRKAVFSVTLCLLLGVVVFLAALPTNVFDISLNTGSLYMSEQEERAFDSRESALAGIQIDDGTDYIGPVVESGAYDLDPGNYTFYLSGSFGCNTLFEIYSPLYAGSGNSKGRVFASTEITPSESKNALILNTNEVIRGARLRISRSGEGSIAIKSITCDNNIYSDTFALAALTMLFTALAMVFLSRREKEFKNREYESAAAALACVLTAVISTAPLARQILLYGHDVSFHLTRIDGIADGLRSGQFPVRLNPTFLAGYGYADPTMYPATFIYFPAVLRLLGVSTIVSYQIFILAINCLTSTLSYFAFKRLFKRRDVAIFATVAYTLCLYRLICVFTRGAIGELLAMAFLPAVLLGMYEMFFGETRIGSRWLVVGFLGLMNCHVLSLEIVLCFCLLFFIINIRRMGEKGRFKALICSAAVVVVLSLWILIPMLDFMRADLYATAYSRSIADDAVYPFELFATFIKSNGLSGDRNDAFTEMPLTVGGILAAGALLFLFLKYFMRSDNNEDSRLSTLGMSCFKFALIALFVSSTLFPWAAVARIPVLGSILSTVQFPWRYLGVASIMLVIVLVVAVSRLAEVTKHRQFVLFICAVVFALSCSPYLDGYMQNDSQGVMLSRKYTPLSTFYIGGQEYMHVGTSKTMLEARDPIVISHGADISEMTKRYLNVDFQYSGAAGYAYADLPLYYYSGYRAKDNNGNDLEVLAGDNGVVRVMLQSGSGAVSVKYVPPASYRIAEGITIIAAIVIIVLLVRSNRKVNMNGQEISAT